MISLDEIFDFVKKQYNITPDFPWVRTPDHAILRHTENHKWFVAIMSITEDKLGINGNKQIDALLLKCDPILISSLRSEKGIFPAYHTNKEHWIAVVLEGDFPKERIFELIDLSYELTKK